MSEQTVAVPIALSCFCLTENSCDLANGYRIAPITQPGYTFLRLSDGLIEPDIQDPVDLHSTQPWNMNSRIADLGSGALLEDRLGVYVHWTLPQFYRTGYSAAGDAASDLAQQAERQRRAGFPPRASHAAPGATPAGITGAPQFRPVPNVWIVVRRLDITSVIPSGAPIEPLKAWVVLSDALRNINDLPDDVDLQVDVSPFINVNPDDVAGKPDQLIEGQSEVFLGMKLDIHEWEEQHYDNVASLHLTTMSSGNPLFADFTHQNMNVFTMLDNFEYPNPTSTDPNHKSHLTQAHADYFVLGYHSQSQDDPLITAGKPATVSAAGSGTSVHVTEPTNLDRLNTCNMQLKDPILRDSNGNAVQRDGQDVQIPWLAQEAQARLLCHAVTYGVNYNRSTQPTTVLAQQAASALRAQPISVGVTPIDALLAYSRSFQDRDSGRMSEMEKDLLLISTLLQNNQGDDDVDGLQAAADEQLELAFTKVNAGTEWKLKQFQDPRTGPVQATPSEVGDLIQINAVQRAVDYMTRRQSINSWYLFASWWNWTAASFIDEDIPTYVDNFRKLADQVTQLQSLWATNGTTPTKTIIDTKAKCQTSTSDRFYQRKDPTLLFGNISKGWDADFMSKIPVRLDNQILTASTEEVRGWKGASQFFDGIVANKRIPAELKQSMRTLLSEFLQLREDNQNDQPAPGKVVPLYHVEPSITTPSSSTNTTTPSPPSGKQSRDRWRNTQPWRPLFVEWEAKYYHIPFDKWILGEHHQYSNWGAKVMKYGFDQDKAIALGPNEKPDIRTVRGRNYLIPQGASTLNTLVSQIFENTNPSVLENDYHLSKDEQGTLLDILSDVDIVSFPLTGLTSQLLTQFEGSHVNPLVRLPGLESRVIAEAKDVYQKAVDAAFKNRSRPPPADLDVVMRQMNSSTTTTPYGDLPVGDSDDPMKPVTHGQLVFTQINVIDKFGQAISIVDPEPWRLAQNRPITPCISDTYYPGIVDDKKPSDAASQPNIIVPLPNNSHACPFISLTPSINQPARLNAHFLLDDSITPTAVGAGTAGGTAISQRPVYRSCTDWDNPVVGWLVVNYADQGIQVFLADGTFYRERRRGGRTKGQTVASRKWLPFEPPATSMIADAKTKQLDFLIEQLKNDDYFEGMIAMLNQSIDMNQGGKTLPPPPSSYGAYTSTMVGKPTVLVNAGWSLELSQEANKSWSTLQSTAVEPSAPPVPGKQAPRTLLKPNGSSWESWPDATPRNPVPDDTQAGGYHFKVKIGDGDRNYDGLLGFFVPRDDHDFAAHPELGDTDFSRIYTYLTEGMPATMPAPNADPRIDLNGSSTYYPTLTPYYQDLLSTSFTSSAMSTQQDHDARLRRLLLIIDPFQPLHAYTAILPNKTLQLGNYIIEQALSRISAFWRIGPVLVAADVPAFEQTKVLKGDELDEIAKQAAATAQESLSTGQPPAPKVVLPISAGMMALAEKQGDKAGLWYLQPYWAVLDNTSRSTMTPGDGVPASPASSSTSALPNTHFNALGVAPSATAGDATTLKLQDGPYSMVEGFLQISRPISSLTTES
ncbi:hypothetical protein SAICODRAFT_8951 [Saitoella complicata NRRL Y-17804]|uniref:Channel forming colicins domain-containing protein n=1 Tax=Saitoella complicata (strain BCRC 22490 / CBS 7301 / JCM 7358 / NBRC 10748 / NRRL Y-17804) TaxID=698492 RepID=A0A0E9NPS6_SAICN|nr:uncharacterized protein SAICODRAFT_8951 [Saitoella complicata NRRL Y-17804]ODQ51289.1 hypothetical protein SAICODRAFT_8951 [Saitoella complicata NRRL Y-17804]GAO51691.1 hypothetical protein G7K_5784-t1 [Saitoella complicata NRRL Y-17804]